MKPLGFLLSFILAWPCTLNGDACAPAFHSNLVNEEALAPALLQRFSRSFRRAAAAHEMYEIAHYAPLEPIGEGKFGTVFKGRDRQTQAPISIKRPNAEKSAGPHFANERRALKIIARGMSSSPHGVYPFPKLLESHEERLLITDFFEGETLENYLYRKQQEGALFTLPMRLTLMLAILEASILEHEMGLIHFDLASTNILVREETDAFVVRLIDFGGAYPYGQEVLNFSFTPLYGAPEITKLYTPLHALPTIDIYALGIIFYELVAQPIELPGKSFLAMISMSIRPFHKIVSENKTLDQSVRDIIRKATADDDRERYLTVKKMRADVKRVLTSYQSA